MLATESVRDVGVSGMGPRVYEQEVKMQMGYYGHGCPLRWCVLYGLR